MKKIKKFQKKQNWGKLTNVQKKLLNLTQRLDHVIPKEPIK